MFFAKPENKFATLHCAAHILFCFLLFPSEEHTLLQQVFFFFFSFLQEAAGDRMEMASKHIFHKN